MTTQTATRTDQAKLDIADLAARTGMAASGLRYYEKRGLIEPVGRNRLRRTHAPGVLDRITLIGCAKAAGFTLAQTGRFLAATPSDTELRHWTAERAVEPDAEIARLPRTRDSLRRAATCEHVPLVERPEFKDGLGI